MNRFAEPGKEGRPLHPKKQKKTEIRKKKKKRQAGRQADGQVSIER